MNLRWAKTRPLRILDFDLENRPLSYAGPDWTTAEITAIAASWVGEDEVHCWLLSKDSDPVVMLNRFVSLYDEADMVTGHYIRKHDLPILNGNLMRQGLPPLSSKLTCDTKLDMVKKKDLSATQASLGVMLGIAETKHTMTPADWEESNRLTPEGLKETAKRVTDDVRQHKALRLRMLEVGALRAPKVWTP